MDSEKIWQTVLGELEITVPKMQFETWFKNSSLEIKGDTACVLVSNLFAKNWLMSKYQDDILKAIQKSASDIQEVVFKVKKEKPIQNLAFEIFPTEQVKAKVKDPLPITNINRGYTFDAFIVGNNNSLAYAVAQEVATNPGARHNPFFIYGGVGLGKTHLAQAIGNEILEKNPRSKITYVSCETFTNDFINAIATKKMADFKKTYREVDVLIVDDIQFLSSKEGSQEEFFHTFNSLQQQSRQIILTADKTPQAIPALEGRLASRFGGGMVVDMQPPNFETRMAILKEKSKEKGYVVDDNVIEYIAKNISSNIRELEGALNRLAIHCQYSMTKPTIGVAQEILKDMVSLANKKVDTAEIISAVSKFFNITKDEILSKNRKRELVLPRQIAIYLIREQTNKSFPEIGKIMGGKDHTTIIHAEKKIIDLIKTDIQIKENIEQIRQGLFEIKN